MAINEQIQQGRYASASEVVRDGLRALEDQESAATWIPEMTTLHSTTYTAPSCAQQTGLPMPPLRGCQGPNTLVETQ